ncbi:hypothetical protein E4U45_008281 [Claviceps purpurea]|nr:hypothetical protein E4U45_008281 [Claviceps purpurea]
MTPPRPGRWPTLSDSLNRSKMIGGPSIHPSMVKCEPVETVEAVRRGLKRDAAQRDMIITVDWNRPDPQAPRPGVFREKFQVPQLGVVPPPWRGKWRREQQESRTLIAQSTSQNLRPKMSPKSLWQRQMPTGLRVTLSQGTPWKRVERPKSRHKQSRPPSLVDSGNNRPPRSRYPRRRTTPNASLNDKGPILLEHPEEKERVLLAQTLLGLDVVAKQVPTNRDETVPLPSSLCRFGWLFGRSAIYIHGSA